MLTAYIELPPAPRCAGSPLGRANPYFSLPANCRRIIVFSNARHLPLPDFSPGDLLVHLNRARSAAAAMQATRGLTGCAHILLVRASDLDSGKWFWPRRLDGYQAVITLRHETWQRQPWYSAYRAAGGANPSTGFIAANNLRAWHPHTPIILCGFAPGRDIGTFRSPTHQWDLEARWYADSPAKFTLIPPPFSGEDAAASPRLHLLVCSCSGHEEQRRACRETWLAHLPPSVTYRFFMGGNRPPDGEPDVMWLPGVDDSYIGLPAKVVAAMQRAHAELPDWQWLGKVDDDTYLRADQLLPWLQPTVCHVGRSRRGRYCPGGAGYFLARPAVQAVLAHAVEIPPTGAEDKLITSLAVKLGYPITDCPGLHQYLAEGLAISAHKITPAAMRAIC